MALTTWGKKMAAKEHKVIDAEIIGQPKKKIPLKKDSLTLNILLIAVLVLLIGGAGYAIGRYEYNHVPLVEVRDNFLELLIFNHNNEIVKGYFFNGNFYQMKELELEYRKMFLNPKYNEQEKVYRMKIREKLDS